MTRSNDWEPTVRSRELGERLRTAMERAGYTAADIARGLDWSHGRVSRLLSGKRGGNSLDVMAFLTKCNVTGDQRTQLLALAGDLREPGWVLRYGRRMPAALSTLVDYENQSVTIDEFEVTLIPGLLQTEGYARAVIRRSVNIPAAELQARVEVRMARQQLLDRGGGPRVRFFIHEFALHLPVGGAETMSEQLHALLRASVRPHVAVRVVPVAAGAHPAMAGSFRVMDVRDFKPIVYLESETTYVFQETAEEIEAYRAILAGLEGTALDQAQSRELIADLAVTRYREDPDAPA